MKVLIINPGATSTKIAVFDEEEQLFKRASTTLPRSWTGSTGSLTRQTSARRPFWTP